MSGGKIQNWAGLVEDPGAGPDSGVLGDGQDGGVDDVAELVHLGAVAARRICMVQTVDNEAHFFFEPGTETRLDHICSKTQLLKLF